MSTDTTATATTDTTDTTDESETMSTDTTDTTATTAPTLPTIGQTTGDYYDALVAALADADGTTGTLANEQQHRTAMADARSAVSDHDEREQLTGFMFANQSDPFALAVVTALATLPAKDLRGTAKVEPLSDLERADAARFVTAVLAHRAGLLPTAPTFALVPMVDDDEQPMVDDDDEPLTESAFPYLLTAVERGAIDRAKVKDVADATASDIRDAVGKRSNGPRATIGADNIVDALTNAGKALTHGQIAKAIGAATGNQPSDGAVARYGIGGSIGGAKGADADARFIGTMVTKDDGRKVKAIRLTTEAEHAAATAALAAKVAKAKAESAA